MGNKIVRRPYGLDLDYYNGGGTKFSITPSYLIRSLERTAGDNPGHRSLERAGVLATNPMTTVIRDCKLTTGAMTLRNVNKDDSWYGRVTTVRRFATVYAFDETSMSQSRIASIDNKALTLAIKRVREHLQSDFSGPQFLGELRETVKMLRSPFKTLRERFGIFHKKISNPARRKNIANVISSSWLEFAFGVQPAVNDISSIAKLLSSQLSKQPGLARVSATYSDDEGVEFWENHSFTGEVGSNRLYTLRKLRHSRRYVVGVKRDFPSTFGLTLPAQNLIEYGKFDLAEVVPTAWELVPWSWLLDYVVNVGDLLACTYDYNSSVAWVNITDVDECNRTRRATDHYSNPSYREVLGVSQEVFWTLYKRVSRSGANGLGFPSLEFSLPSVGQANNALQAAIQIASSNPKKG